jgi:hypothetical protein
MNCKTFNGMLKQYACLDTGFSMGSDKKFAACFNAVFCAKYRLENGSFDEL